MPEATDKYSTDYYWYQYIINPIADRVCFINPNVITFLGTLLIIPIVQNLLNGGNLLIFITLMITRYYLDCLDGAIARKCNKKSKFGALFDILSDSCLFIILNLIIIYNILQYKSYNIINIFILIVAILHCLYMIKTSSSEILNERSTKNNYFYLWIDKFIHDNGLIFYLLYAYMIKNIV